MNKINFTTFPVIKTERLVLRSLTPEDQNEIFAIRSDKEIAKYLDRPLYTKPEEAAGFINNIIEGVKKGDTFYWGISFKGNEKLVGTICIWQISEEQSKAEIGFELLPEFQRKGIMKEAVPAVINFGFEKLGLSFIEGEVAPGNTSSIKILEKNKFKLVPGSDLNAETVIYQLTK